MVDTTYIELVDRKLSGLSKAEFNGYYKHLLQPTLLASNTNKLNATIQDLIGIKGNNSFHVSQARHSNLKNRDTSIIVEYAFEIDNYSTVFEKEIFVNMVLDKGISRGEVKKDRTTPMEFDYLSNDTYNVALEIPDGYKIKSVPKNVQYKSEPVDFNINYSIEDDLVIMQLNFRIKKLMMYSTDFEAWNEYHKLARAAFAQSVVLIEE